MTSIKQGRLHPEKKASYVVGSTILQFEAFPSNICKGQLSTINCLFVIQNVQGLIRICTFKKKYQPDTFLNNN